MKAVAAHRLVGYGGQDDQRGTNNEYVHAEVKKSGAGQMDFADQRQRNMDSVGGHERVTEWN